MMDAKLYIGNLSRSTSADDLRRLFAPVGTVMWATVILDLSTGLSRGFGFVKMSTQAEAEKVIALFNAYPLCGQPIIVELAAPREERSNRLRSFWAGQANR